MKNLFALILICVVFSLSFITSEGTDTKMFATSESLFPTENLFSSENNQTFFSNSTYSSVLKDSVEEDTESPDYGVTDIANMFNERGFYKSNGFSFDENEIINDFNGNLIYNIPLYNYPLAGDLNFNMALTYNSSVGHQFIVGNKTTYNSFTQRYNMNAPEWIISLNGIAVQVLNFETNFFTTKGTLSTIKDDSVRLLIPGYHYDGSLETAAEERYNTINILAGDGSTISLVRVPGSENADSLYIGNYVYEGKELYYRAKVSYLDPAELYTGYRRRKVELMQGDGSVCIFKEYKRNFADLLTTNTVPVAKKPLILLLESVTDRFGHQINLKYSFNLQTYGRPLLESINAVGYSQQEINVSFEYGIIEGLQNLTAGLKIEHSSEVNGNYTLNYESPVAVIPVTNSGTYKHRANISKIKNILGQQTNIGYENYKRKFRNMLYYNVTNNEYNITNLKRMNYYRNFIGKGTSYGYGSSDTLSVSETGNAKLKSNSNYYHGYGRDAFYTNMVYTKSDSNSGVAKSLTNFEYSYTDVGSGTNTVDSLDLYLSNRTLSSLESGTLNNSSSSNTTFKRYRVYPLYNPNSFYIEQPDLQGMTKLISDSTISDGTEQVNYYKYEKGIYSESGLSGFNGSFLLTSKTNKVNGISRIWNYSYDYQNIIDSFDCPVLSKEETDPFKNKSLSKYLNIYEENFIYKIASNNLVTQSYDLMCFYKIQLDTVQLRKDSSDHILSKKTYEYISRHDSTIGYYGQLRRERSFNNYQLNNYIQTDYEYYRNDTAGKYIYFTGFLPYKNGNLKTITKPNGEQEKYFYGLVSKSEIYAPDNTDESTYIRHKFKMKFNNGTVTDSGATIWDTRFPIRIDNYKINGGTTDTLSINYKSYNIAGNPTRTFGRDLYVSEFKYQPIHRINSITLPGDFSTTKDSVFLKIDTNYIQSSIELKSTGWGNYTPNNQEVVYTMADNYAGLYGCNTFHMTINNSYNQFAFLKLDTSNKLHNFVIIDSAILQIAPISFSASYDGTPIPNSEYSTFVKGVTTLDNSTPNCFSDSLPAGLSNGNSEINLDTFQIYPYCSHCCYKPLRFNIPGLIENIVTNHLNLLGLTINSQYTGPGTSPTGINFNLNFTYCDYSGTNADSWFDLYKPVLFITGKLDLSDTLRYPIVKGGTIKYIYDDANKKIDVISVRNSQTNDHSKIEYSIDGFGNVKQKDIYTDASSSNSYKYKFNYMNLPARNFDALDDSIMFSYDGLGRLSGTKNSDTSSTLNNYAYYNGINYYFGTVSGLIETQSFIDEEGNDFLKYYDAVGNLVREVKTIDDTEPVEDAPQDYMITDYKYDSLYRVTKVKTPNGKIIYYSYDGYGRQSKRITPDAGQTIYIYNDLSNLTYTQDANQKIINTQKYTFRNYDGLNRLTGIGEGIFGIDTPSDGSQYNSTTASDYLTINVYDTISKSIVSNLFNSFYGYTPQFTKGNLAAIAYRTKTSDNWNFKYYSYDERKRVIKMWNIIADFDTLITEYTYNSQDQIIFLYYQAGKSDSKSYYYEYDYAGRMKNTAYHTGPPSDIPEEYTNLASYEYNENSQVSSQRFNSNNLENTYSYNNRNWIFEMNNSGNLFNYDNTYFKNGNVKTQYLYGDYNKYMADIGDLNFSYTYDRSNRLLSSSTSGNIFKLTNTYDKDGNILTLIRKGSVGNTIDSFTYDYYSGTNKLLSVKDVKEQFYYDANGNMTTDSLNKNTNIKYDYRNLITQILHKEIISADTNVYFTFYSYDEAGNRFAKTVYKSENITNPPDTLTQSDVDNNNDWELYNVEIYSRDVSGKELAIYKDGNILEYPIYGLDMIGKIKNDEAYYYFKDHLGSVRATVNSSGEVFSAQDLDAWGYLLQDRSYNSDSSKFKFTGKERDVESDYDYFGARYYDSRIGRWGQTEPLLDKYISISPYCYGLNNPTVLLDVDGLDLVVGGDKTAALNDLKSLFSDVEIQNRITADDNGLVSFDVNGLDVSSDAALELVNLLVTSENKYLFEVSDETYGIASENSPAYNIGDKVPYSMSESTGSVNFSISARNINGGTGYKKEIPKENYSGQVTLGTGKWTIPTKSKSNIYLQRSDVVFHELSENYHRTNNKEPYARKDKSGAHKRAIADAKRYKNQRGKSPGKVGTYEP